VTRKLKALGLVPTLRLNRTHRRSSATTKNLTLDARARRRWTARAIRKLEAEILAIAGVVDTGCSWDGGAGVWWEGDGRWRRCGGSRERHCKIENFKLQSSN